MLNSVNPYNNEVIGKFKATTIEELDSKLTLAQQAFTVWRNTGFDDRSIFLKRLANTLRENKEEYATLISTEMGKVIRDSKKEVNKSAMALEYFAENGENYLNEKPKKTDDGEGRVVYEPLGVILGIMPWNYPFWQFFRFAATTLMAGNTIILKHSSNVPACSKKIEEIFERVSFPGGVFQSLVISSSKINNVIKDFRVQGVSLTGIKPDMPAYNEELFGPVASVFVVGDGLEASRIANNSVYGLGASIWTKDIERGLKFASEIQAGIIYINAPVRSRPELPFGGTKKSGFGREMAGEGSREFTNKKSLWYPLE